MFGATFVFPMVMGLDPNLGVMMSGVATAVFLLVVRGRIPSYLGTSASFVGAVAAIRAAGGSSAVVTGAVAVSGAVLALVGLAVQRAGSAVVNRLFPPVVAGAVVLLIGFNLAPVVAQIYWPQDQWTALATMAVVLASGVLLRGFWGRVSVFIGLVFGFAFSWLLDVVTGPITARDATGAVTTHLRVNLDAVAGADWIGLPSMHAPEFRVSAVLLALPAVIALVAENTGHVRAVAEMTGTDLDGGLGRALFADGLATAVAAGTGSAPTTTFAENIGVMAATRVYSTAAYWFAAGTAVLLGLCPKFGAVVAATPGGVLGGITVVLYGMIGLLGADIWVRNRVDFGDPVNLVPTAAGVVAGVGGVSVGVSGGFTLSGITLGTLIVLTGHHALRRLSGRRAAPNPATAGAADATTPLPADVRPAGRPRTPDTASGSAATPAR